MNIPKEKLMNGINIALIHSAELLESSKILYRMHKFQESIPLAIISYEESSKAQFLLNKLEAKTDLDEKEWRGIHDHAFKLLNVESKLLNEIRLQSEKEIELIHQIITQTVGINYNESKDEEIKTREFFLTLIKKLQNLKESCLYADWNNRLNEWTSFKILSSKQQRAICFVTGMMAEDLLLRTLYLVDIFENPAEPEGVDKLVLDEQKKSLFIVHKTDKLKKRPTVKNLQKSQEYYKKHKSIVSEGLRLIYEFNS